MTLFTKHQLLQQSIAKTEYFIINTNKIHHPIQTSLRRFFRSILSKYREPSIHIPVVNFLSFFSLCSFVHPIIIICIYISFFCIQCRSFLFFLFSSFKIFVLLFIHFLPSIVLFRCYICYIDRFHGLFETIWCFFIALSPYMRRMSMCHTYIHTIPFASIKSIFCINETSSLILAQW